ANVPGRNTGQHRVDDAEERNPARRGRASRGTARRRCNDATLDGHVVRDQAERRNHLSVRRCDARRHGDVRHLPASVAVVQGRSTNGSSYGLMPYGRSAQFVLHGPIEEMKTMRDRVLILTLLTATAG